MTIHLVSTIDEVLQMALKPAAAAVEQAGQVAAALQSATP
jgi:hypothetical protein